MATAIIGLDRDLAESIRAEIRSPQNRVHIYDSLPEAYSINGDFIIKDGKRRIIPDFVYYYSYFPDALAFRKALALSEVQTYPPVSRTILHDDKDLSLLQCVQTSRGTVRYNPNPRGYIPGPTVRVAGWNVFKQGNDHCGENKQRSAPGELMDVGGPSLVEPYIEGESYRALFIGHDRWAIHYESEDWRKNVGTTSKTIHHFKDFWQDPEYIHVKKALIDGSNLQFNMQLDIVGIDYILPKDGSDPVLLELNCYPEVPDEAKGAFIKRAILAYRDYKEL